MAARSPAATTRQELERALSVLSRSVVRDAPRLSSSCRGARAPTELAGVLHGSSAAFAASRVSCAPSARTSSGPTAAPARHSTHEPCSLGEALRQPRGEERTRVTGDDARPASGKPGSDQHTGECGRRSLSAISALTMRWSHTCSDDEEKERAVTQYAVFDPHLESANKWIDELSDNLELPATERRRALHALRAGLHAIRDRLPAAEVVDLGAQLPVIIRGFYYEGWTFANDPTRIRDGAAMVARVKRELMSDPRLDPVDVLRAVIHLLVEHVSAGEIRDIMSTLPRPIAALWQDLTGHVPETLVRPEP